jgi:hypothetical protein
MSGTAAPTIVQSIAVSSNSSASFATAPNPASFVVAIGLFQAAGSISPAGSTLLGNFDCNNYNEAEVCIWSGSAFAGNVPFEYNGSAGSSEILLIEIAGVNAENDITFTNPGQLANGTDSNFTLGNTTYGTLNFLCCAGNNVTETVSSTPTETFTNLIPSSSTNPRVYTNSLPAGTTTAVTYVGSSSGGYVSCARLVAIAGATVAIEAEVAQAGLIVFTKNSPKAETSQTGVLSLAIASPKAETSQTGVLSLVRYLTGDVAQAGVVTVTKNNPKVEMSQAGVLSLSIQKPKVEVSQAGALSLVTYTVAIADGEVAQAGVLTFVRYPLIPPVPPPTPPNPASNVVENATTSQDMTILLNTARDIYIDTSGNLAVGTGQPALLQICQAYLEAQLREMVFQYNQGMPTFDDVFQGNNLSAYIAAGRQRLMSIPSVLSVPSFTAKYVGNQMQYTAQILTVYSNTILTVTNQGVAT